MKKLFGFLILFLLLSYYTNLTAQILPYQDSTLTTEQRVDDLIGRMTLDEKIGQMMQFDLGGIQTNPGLVTSYNVGSMLSGGSSDPFAGNSALNWTNVYDTMQTYALKTRLKIPIIYGVDAVHGHSNIVGATIFPHNIGLGCTGNPELVKAAARITALEIAATGIDWTFAPCIAVTRDERWGRTYEGFGETAELAQIFGAASIKGLQGESLSNPTSILACVKHFVGDGGTTNGIDQGNTELDETAIRNIHLPGYITSIDSGVGSIMISYSSINGLKMHRNTYWITDVLKNELGFKGIVISDYNGINQVAGNYKTCIELSINAGIDMVMAPSTYFPEGMKELINEGKISLERVDDAVRRILTVKFNMGLFERPFADRSLLPLVGSAAHREVARRCVRESMVLLKKKDGILPLKKNDVRILVAGSNADDLGNQCGGWTISWQGQSGTPTTGTTILQGMKNAAPNAQVEFSETGDFTNTAADYSVVVVGETPYAEGSGTRSDLGISRDDVELIRKMKSYGAPVVLIIVSGRPLILEKVLHFSDVIFEAWLPGTEGEGVADVLFGDYQPKGKLSLTWPKNMQQIPINIGDVNYEPLYEYGFGITSTDDSPSGSSPVCLSSILMPDGKHFELTFNKQINESSLSNAEFTIYRDGVPVNTTTNVSLKANDHTTLLIEADTTYFKKYNVCTISFNRGSIQSADGGILQIFNQFEVFNEMEPEIINIPAKIEAENYSDMLGVKLVPTNDINGGYEVQSFDNGDWLLYNVNIPEDGEYYISFRIASESIQGQIILSCGGKTRTITLPTSGGVDQWMTTSNTKIPLSQGETTLLIRITQGGFNLNWISFSNSPVSVEEDKMVPLVNILEQNYPNPFNPVTVIGYTIGTGQLSSVGTRRGVFVQLKVYDILGNELATLVNENKQPGNYQIEFNGSNLATGVYIYKLTTDKFTDAKKLMIIK